MPLTNTITKQAEGDRLIELFLKVDDNLTYINKDGAKTCAATCVKEVINDINNHDTTLDHWNKVLNYIQKK